MARHSGHLHHENTPLNLYGPLTNNISVCHTSLSWKVLPVVRSALSTIAMMNSTEILKLIISEEADYAAWWTLLRI